MRIIKRPEGRKELAKLFKGTGAEIGVERGKFSQIIMETANKMYAVDLWKNYGNYRQHVSDAEYLEIFEDANRRLSGKDVVFVVQDSVKAASEVPDELDWVYVDAAHDYTSVLNDLRAWYPKVKSGGIVSGHDFTGNHKDVHKAVLDFLKEIGIEEMTEWCGEKSHSYSFHKP